MNPKHIDKITEPQRRAIAPYNFVELPDQVVEAQPLPSGDRYYPTNYVEILRQTGRIECTLTTESPLYIRCGLTTDNFAKYSEIPEKYLKPPKNATEEQNKHWEEEKKQWETERRTTLSPFFTYRTDEFPVLPGSSLRGMLRTLVEIGSFSKIERVSDQDRLFFRAVAANKNNESWGKEYKKYVEPEKNQAGYLKKDSEGWYIHPAKTIKGKTFAWVRETSLSLPDFQKFNDKLYQPQYRDVSYLKQKIAVDTKDISKRLFAEKVDNPEIYTDKGVLVTSGNMKQSDKSSPRKNHCLVFDCIVFEPSSNPTKFRIDKTAIQHYLNALTNFQKEPPFGKDSGILIEDRSRPVFYLPPENGHTVAFFGQSPNFRIPYSPKGNGHATTVIDFIPENLRKLALIDLADTIFGWVKQESENEKLPQGFERQRASRVFVTDALYQNNQNGIWYSETPVTPQILSEPKPTCFPHYLVQPSADKSELKHYASEPVTETVIRGHKLYWHKGNDQNFQLLPPKKVIDSPKKVSDTQTTLIKPIKEGVTFKFDIYFENLSDVELGALLWVLNVAKDDAYRLKLGMGKPLGLGAVKIEPTLYLSNRKKRYQNLFDSNDCWEKGETEINKDISDYVSKFETYMLEQLNHTGDFKKLCRIQMLLAMLSWPGITDVETKTRYMEIERDCKKYHIGQCKPNDKKINEYKECPVLPDPLDVMREVTGVQVECERPSPSLPESSIEQITQLFSEGQEIEAKVIDIQVKEGKKLLTVITYAIQGSDCQAQEEIYKHKVSLAVDDILKVSIVKANGKSVRKVKRV